MVFGPLCCVDHSGLFCAILDYFWHSEPVWTLPRTCPDPVRICFVLFWAILGYVGHSEPVRTLQNLNLSGPLQNLPGPVQNLFWAMLGYFGAILVHFGPFWGYFELFWAILGLFWAILGYFGHSEPVPQKCTIVSIHTAYSSHSPSAEKSGSHLRPGCR